jgi:predicted SAM-dependent methyltransferase
MTLVLGKAGVLHEAQREFIKAAKEKQVQWADVTRSIPEPDHSVEVLYSSHMIEHLGKSQALAFLKEVRRILKPGGIIRLAVPNIRFHVDNYLQHNDADKFVHDTRLSLQSHGERNTLFRKLQYLIVGERHHQWMYDGKSLCCLLTSVGFRDPEVMEPGTTRIKDPGELNLHERVPESVFVEAVNA